MKRVKRFSDSFFIFIGVCFIIWACALFIHLGSLVYRDGLVFISGLYALRVMIIFIAGYLLMNIRFSGVLIGGGSVLLQLGYEVIYPYVYFGFIPDGYYNNFRIIKIVSFLSLLVIFSYFFFKTYNIREVNINRFTFTNVIKWSFLATGLVFISGFISLFVGFVGGNPVQGRVIDGETLIPIKNAEVAVKYGPGGFNVRDEGSFYLQGKAITNEDGYFYIENKRKFLTRMQASGFQPRIFISAKGYGTISLVNALNVNSKNGRSMNIRLVKRKNLD